MADTNGPPMKIACSSASFANEFAAGTLTHPEWLDACANELEVDGVIFDLADFPRTDVEYRAQLKKMATDLGLTVAGVCDRAFFSGDAASEAATFEIATSLGAPLIVASASSGNDGADAWGTFVAAASERARAAKRANVTLAVRTAQGTVCATAADLKRLAKDVDSSWLRYAYALDDADVATDETIRAKSVIAWHDVADLGSFATDDDAEARALARGLARFRGFVVLAGTPNATRTAYHDAIARFAALRAERLVRA